MPARYYATRRTQGVLQLQLNQAGYQAGVMLVIRLVILHERYHHVPEADT